MPTATETLAATATNTLVPTPTDTTVPTATATETTVPTPVPTATEAPYPFPVEGREQPPDTVLVLPMLLRPSQPPAPNTQPVGSYPVPVPPPK